MAANIFHNCIIYILPNGLLKKRIKLFEDKIILYGGTPTYQPSKTLPTHIIVEDSLLTNPTLVTDALKAVNLLYESLNSKIVGTLWLSRCLKEKHLLSTESFEFKTKVLLKRELNEECSESPMKKCRIEIQSDVSTSIFLIFEIDVFSCIF